MNRRTLLGLALAATALPFAAQAGEGWVEYTPGLIQDALAEGKTVFVDYSATWCSTCAAQERAINALVKENPAYLDTLVMVRVDWDEYGNHEVTTSRNIPRRSTLLVLKGDQELGRIVAGTSKSAIKDLMDTGVAAAS